jgi:hypothetical protein
MSSFKLCVIPQGYTRWYWEKVFFTADTCPCGESAGEQSPQVQETAALRKLRSQQR